jgi:hypothetical protein
VELKKYSIKTTPASDSLKGYGWRVTVGVPVGVEGSVKTSEGRGVLVDLAGRGV